MRALPAALVLALAFTTACEPAQEAGTAPSKTAAAPAPASPSPTVTPNGVEKLPARDILARARKATTSAKSVRMHGRFKEGGEDYALDFRFSGRTKSTGRFSQGGQHVDLTRIGKAVYIKGNDAFWKEIGGKGAAQLFSGKSIKTTATNRDFADLAAFTDRGGLLAELLKVKGGWDTGKTGTVGGTPTVELVGPDGEKIHVATQGEPYLLLLDGGSANRLEFSAYNEQVDVQAPPSGTVVDADKLQ
ncbi:lipoprotein [Actinomadura viridis]|uniref:Lipoprotein n=1 Tax=Actinomadura viridis TaxID=58110 RepID=A0A931DRQ6_9ACTN|nr:hypothetical protein [Actinomadura viridis]MBG6092611.1 hypothetical protein [Actinomadura viridis]